MLGRKKNICGHWDCDKKIPEGDILCAEHHEKWIEGFIDRCPKCGRFKDIMYYLCLDCYFGRPITRRKQRKAIPDSKKYPKIEYSEAWTDGFMSRNRRYVYVFEFDDGVFYVGHTEDMKVLIYGLKDSDGPSASGYNPRLRYMEMAEDGEAAELRVSELKKLIQSNPSQMSLMSKDFLNHMCELGFEEDS